jgi:hypothetical protein
VVENAVRIDLMPIPREVEQLLEPYSPEVRALALAARELITLVVPDATEIADVSAKVIGYGYGPGYKDTICALILSQREVKIGVARGTELPDPSGLLQGSGKVHRHVPIRELADLRQPGLKPLLEAGVTAWKQRSAIDKSRKRSK